MKKQHSIRFYLIGNVFFLLIICVAVFGSSNLHASELFRISMELFQCNQELGDFYKAADAMDYTAREYIYDPTEAAFSDYQLYEQEARNCLAECRKKVDREMGNRLTGLEAMLDYYAEPLEQYLNGEAGKYETYLLLQYRGQLIADTSTRYYEFLSESLSETVLDVQRKWTDRKTFSIVIIVIMILFVGVWGLIYWRRIYWPIQVMVKNTEKVKQEDYELEPPGAAIQELKVLEDAFADMAVRIKMDIGNLQEKARLEQELLIQENENLMMKNMMTETEFHNLQAQINPHFLFNTMNLISQSAQLHNDMQTRELMDKLSAFLRYTLDKSQHVSTLKEEIQSIENYIYIQQKRFGNRVKFVMDIPEEIPNIAMPAVIIQPLIENAISHGVANMTSEGEIVVSAFVDEEMLQIRVEDNGAGIKAEKLEELLINLHRATEGFAPSVIRSGIGLENVYKRLKIFYGEKAEFVMESEENCGTVIAIGIPKEIWNER